MRQEGLDIREYQTYQELKLRNVEDVEIFAVGTWTSGEGSTNTWTREDLQKMVDAFAHDGRKIPLKLGHTSDSFNRKVAEAMGVPNEVMTGDKMGQGQALLGLMASLTLRGDTLIAGFANVPEILADMIEAKMFNAISSEIEFSDDHSVSLVTGVALLGVEEPAVESLASLETASVFGNREKASVYSVPLATPKALKREVKTVDKIELTKDTKFSEMAANFQEEGVAALTAMAVALGLPETATLGDMLRAIMGLKGQAPEPEEEPNPEELPMSAEAKAEMAKMQKNLDGQAIVIASFQHDKRAAHFTKMAEKWDAVPGTPEEIGERLATIEAETSEATVATVVETYQVAQKAADEAGVLTVLGKSRKHTSNEQDPTAIKIAEFAKENKLTIPVATLRWSKESDANQREVFEYRERMKSGNGAGR